MSAGKQRNDSEVFHEHEADPLDRNFTITENESSLSDNKRRLAALVLYGRGYVILRNAIPWEIIARARQHFFEVLADCAASGNGEVVKNASNEYRVSKIHRAVFQKNAGRWRVFPKLLAPLNVHHIIANRFALAIIRELLGEVICNSVSSDVCTRGAVLQAPHRDIGFYKNGPFSYCVNVPLMHCGLHNGPLEVYPGGNHTLDGGPFERQQVSPFPQEQRNPVLEQLTDYLPVKKVELRPGDVLIRDVGMLHRGTENPTDEPRAMLTINYLRVGGYYRFGDTRFNVDGNVYRGIDEEVKPLFRHTVQPMTKHRLVRATRKVKKESHYWLLDLKDEIARRTAR